MELVFALLFLVGGMCLFLLGLYQEYDKKEDEEQEKESDHLVIILLGSSMTCFFFGGVCMLWITQWYYNVTTNLLVESPPMQNYAPFMWLGVGLGIFVLLFLVPKILAVSTETTEQP